MAEFSIEEKEQDSNTLKPHKATPVKRLVTDFFEYTTAHGLGRLASAAQIAGRIFWILCVAGAVTMFVLQLAQLFDKYLNIKPTSTTLNIKYDQSVPFPAITVCNLNMIKKSYLQSIPEFEELEDDFEDIWEDYSLNSTEDDDYWYDERRRRRDIPLEEFININQEIKMEKKADKGLFQDDYVVNSNLRQKRSTQNNTTSASDDDYDDYCEDYDEEGNCLYEEEAVDRTFEYQERVRVLLANKTFSSGNSSLTKGGHQFWELVQRCTWKGYQCKNATKFWSSFWDYKYGNCYVFNNGKNIKGEKRPILYSKKPGSTKGVRMLLGIDQDEYVGLLSQIAGVRVVVKDQGEMAFPAEEGISIAPGYSAYIGIRKKLIKRVDPFGNKSCIPNSEKQEENLYNQKYGTKYSVQSCMKSCLANHQLKECGCAEVDFPTGKAPCNPKNQESNRCIAKTNTEFTENKIGCSTKCRQPCTQTIFQASVSVSRWPSQEYEKTLLEELYGYNKDPDGFLKNNFLEVVIFFEELNVEEVEQHMYYNVNTLLSDIGGQIGLWIGLSVLTVCEIIELIFLIFRTMILKCLSKNKIKSKSSYSQ